MTVDYDTSVLPAPTRLGQGTAVEMTRAAAEVAAAVQAARQCPRNINMAVAEMENSCKQLGMAQRAFYAFPRAKQTVRGPTIHLARELARIWGNLDYGIAELRRDDGFQSEMKASAWDMQTNTRSSSIFIVPHKRDTKEGVVVLTDMRDIYENNTNNASRRVREAIFALLPPWFKDQAIELCNQTLKAGASGPLFHERVANMVTHFRAMGVTELRLETKTGRARDAWTPDDVAELGIVFASIQRGELTVDEAFPPERVTIEEIVGQAQPAAPASPAPAAQPPAAEPGAGDAPPKENGKVTSKTRARLAGVLATRGVVLDDDKRDVVSRVLQRRVESVAAITEGEAVHVIAAVEAAAPGLDLVSGHLIPDDAGADPADYAEADPATGTGQFADPSEGGAR